MTKTLIIIGTALGAVLVAGALLATFAPKKITITTTQYVNAPSRLVYDHLRFMKHFPAWSPFRVTDPEQKFKISGIDGTVGATFSWKGVKENSQGHQSIVALQDNRQVAIQCQITAPFQANPTFSYTLNPYNTGVNVVQQFNIDMPVPANIFSLLFGLKAKMAATNQLGLTLLKKVAEQQHLTYTSK